MQINWGDAPSWIMAVTAVLGVLFGYKQLKGLVDALTLNRLATVLQLETDLNDRKFRLADLAGQIQLEKAKKTPNTEIIEAYQNTLKAAQEHYLNAVDRLAYCIARGYFPARDWKAEYRDYISDILKSPAFAQFFLANTDFRNVKDLNDRWKRES